LPSCRNNQIDRQRCQNNRWRKGGKGLLVWKENERRMRGWAQSKEEGKSQQSTYKRRVSVWLPRSPKGDLEELSLFWIVEKWGFRNLWEQIERMWSGWNCYGDSLYRSYRGNSTVHW
jgi:hypothetical protein